MIGEKELQKRSSILEFQSFYSASMDHMECDQTLGEPESFQYNLPHKNSLNCKCKGKASEHTQCLDPLERKRQKRKQYKKRLKVRQREEKQNAYKELQVIIEEIYKLLDSFEEAKPQILKCIELIEADTDRFYEFINLIIKDQVDSIRREIRCLLQRIPKEIDNQELIRQIFDQFERIQLASPEVEKIINLFIMKTAEKTKQIIPLQKNLDKMTFRFIIKNDLQNNKNFGFICQKMFNELEKHQRQKQIFQAMLDIRNNQSSSEENEYEDDETSSEESNSEGQEMPSPTCNKQQSTSGRSRGNPQYSELSQEQYWSNKQNQITPNHSHLNGYQKKGRPKKKKRATHEFDSSFETINNRLKSFVIKNQQRIPCNVPEEWREKMKERAELLKYSKIISKKQDK